MTSDEKKKGIRKITKATKVIRRKLKTDVNLQSSYTKKPFLQIKNACQKLRACIHLNSALQIYSQKNQQCLRYQSMMKERSGMVLGLDSIGTI